ncbi:uncharacterized protein K452DRAFT_234076 [Neofusicoccum parvum]|uniref:Uncharacterized protein K452DRAFT_234076 n=1 Tax=Neofusicoccum parvum TaxID=310453 RepID=A0ACB5SAZ0_9PEZI|nr:uncharacterized protein K452DRAFT_234076 [Neofusicoccum parvum]
MESATGQIEPEAYWVKPTPHVPNSRLPILVYRDALKDTSPENILATIEPNGWLKGGQWKAYYVAHFHSNAHECYGVIKGSNVYLLGKSDIDPDVDEKGQEYGLKLFVQKGDVFVFPAGIAHASFEDKDDYEFVGLYPDGPLVDGTRYDMNYAKAGPEETKKLAEASAQVPIPHSDPFIKRPLKATKTD